MGESWQQLIWPYDTTRDVIGVGHNGLMAIVSNSGEQRSVVFSSDNGQTVRELNEGLGNVYPMSFACESQGTVFIRTDSGGYRSVLPSLVDTRQIESQTALSVRPVPAADEITLTLTGVDPQRVRIELIASNGVSTEYIRDVDQTSAIAIDISTLRAGVYVIAVHTDKGTLTSRCVISR
jgi:hypothetical protein